MSLFSLFSRPKVEKARGYAESGPDPAPNLRTNFGNGSKSDLLSRAGPDVFAGESLPRAASAMSMRRPASRATNRPLPPPPVSSRKGSAFEPPPLFQAFPQALKYGMLQVSTMSAETVLQKTRTRRAGGALGHETARSGSVGAGGNIDAKRMAKTTLRHAANGSITQVELPKKLFVLITSGYLLQYAEDGPSNRLPEKVLQLGRESAAFVCDLVPGKHYVLQISQAVDQQGVMIANSGSIFAKLGLRSAAAKRLTSNILLVMSDVAEMNEWMTAIREEIKAMGGQRARPDTAVRPVTRDAEDELDELNKSPSRSHRYQVRRDPSKISLIITPSTELLGTFPPPSRIQEDDERSETGTIDEIEEEAERLAEESRSSPAKAPREPDAQSLHSSSAPSLDQQRLNSLRSSQRVSRSTVATTIATSRTNSLTGSPSTEELAKDSSDSSADSTQSRPAYRMLSSYGLGRRRSAMPLLGRKEKPLPSLDVASQASQYSADQDSPVTGRNSPLPSIGLPRKLTLATSEPNLRAAADIKAKHDSKMPTPPILFEEGERPLSIVGDLPSPASLAHDRSPNKRLSLIHAATAQANAQRASIIRSGKRQSSAPFSLPLKINPSTPENRPPTRQEQRGSFNKVENGNGDPVVHILTAKIDASPRTPGVSSNGSPPEVPAKNPSRTPSGRLSLFPSQLPSPPMQPPVPGHTPNRSPSSANVPTFAPAQTNSRTLKRPTSMQVHSDPVPFLRNLRASTVGPPAAVPSNTRVFTPPIRSLKPSRSSTYMGSRAPSPSMQQQAHDPFSLTISTFDIPDVPEGEEAADKPTPLPERAMSPLPNRPPSRNTNKMGKLRTRGSLPELDLGIPVVGLGPPAPPPQAPLPLPPTESRPGSPLPGVAAGLGIRVV